MSNQDLRSVRIAQAVLFAAESIVVAVALYGGAFVWSLS